MKNIGGRPAAISFAFPGPADYPAGIIGDLPNLPAFRGGVALGPMLGEKFKVPVFINNDGNLFAYGEAIAGLLPEVNALLAGAGSPKRFATLFGVTLGTGFGGGLVVNGNLHIGDNSAAGEIWSMRHKLDPLSNAEEGASIRAVRRFYAEGAGIDPARSPEPAEIYRFAKGEGGDREAARGAFERLGEIVGDALANAVTLVDGLAVIGGGLSGAHEFFLPRVVREMNGSFRPPGGGEFPRLESRAFNLEDPREREGFIRGDTREIAVPGGGRRVSYDPLMRVGVGISRLGTARAVGIGAYAFALGMLDRQESRGGRGFPARPASYHPYFHE
jgi:glucokinase